MSNDFSINTSIQMADFNNSINEFNKMFKQASSKSVGEFADGTNFSEIFNSVGKTELKGGAQYNTFEPLELKNNLKQISPVRKTANDIGDGIKNSIMELNALNKQADTDFETFASGGDISVHDVMISAQKSSLAMAMAIQLRNQALNAYNELRNTSI